MEKKDLSKNNYIGKVIYNEDETYSGRCKIRVFGLFDGLDDELIPWFAPANISEFSSQYGGGNLSVPKLGAYVRVRFPNNDILNGEYTAIQNIDPNLIGKLNPENYQGTHVLLYDADNDLIIVFQPKEGLKIGYGESEINLYPDNRICIQSPNNSSMIQLNGGDITVTSNNSVSISSPNVSILAGKDGKDTGNIGAYGNTVRIGKGGCINPAINPWTLSNILIKLNNKINQKMNITSDTLDLSGLFLDSVKFGS